MGAVDAMTKVSTEIDTFVRDLNAKTLAAAKDTDQSNQYKRFTDILKYDPSNDNTLCTRFMGWNATHGKDKSILFSNHATTEVAHYYDDHEHADKCAKGIEHL